MEMNRAENNGLGKRGLKKTKKEKVDMGNRTKECLMERKKDQRERIKHQEAGVLLNRKDKR